MGQIDDSLGSGRGNRAIVNLRHKAQTPTGFSAFLRVIENAFYQGGLRQHSGDSNGLKPACSIASFLREIMSLKKNHTAHWKTYLTEQEKLLTCVKKASIKHR